MEHAKKLHGSEAHQDESAWGTGAARTGGEISHLIAPPRHHHQLADIKFDEVTYLAGLDVKHDSVVDLHAASKE
jgi:hypothetical protein